MDGTLVDSERIYREGYRRAFLQKGISIDLAEIESWSGQNSEETLDRIDNYTTNRKISQEIRMMRIDHFKKRLEAGDVSLHDHAKALLTFCKNKGLKIGLATSTSKDWALKILTRLGIDETFDFTVFGDEAQAFKPAPDIYYLALERADLTVNECLVVEDSKSGILAARRAGLSVVQLIDANIKTQYSHPDVFRQVNSLKEIEAIVMEILST
jgi:HAD superfamily hydrolase (TIGR01509 family)